MEESSIDGEIDHISNHTLQLKSVIVDQINQGVIIINSRRRICYANIAFQKMSGYTLNDIIGKSTLLFSTSTHHDHFYRVMWKSLKRKGSWEGEVWENNAKGQPYPVTLKISSYHENGEIYYIGICSELTQLRQKHEELHKLAYYDGITSLPNKQLFYQHLNTTIAQSRRYNHGFALFYLDIDNFKCINDYYGHATGDHILMSVCKRIGNVIREVDFFARIGGDEFSIILPQIQSAEHSEKVAEKITKILSKPFTIKKRNIKATTSIGICHFPSNGTKPEQLLHNADIAMYHAKSKGKNSYQFFSNNSRRNTPNTTRDNKHPLFQML